MTSKFAGPFAQVQDAAARDDGVQDLHPDVGIVFRIGDDIESGHTEIRPLRDAQLRRF